MPLLKLNLLLLLNKKKICSSSILRFKQEFITINDEDFPVLVIPGHSKIPAVKKEMRRQKNPAPPPRYKSIPIDNDWTNLWPTAHSFRWSVVPFPVRQGYVEKSENDGIMPVKYGNAELMKIPNFLHLTPNHIKKHCAAIKQFCSPWPESLKSDEEIEKNFVLNVETSDYVVDAVTIRDDRARLVTISLKLSSLHLDNHARDKFIRLAGNRYNKNDDILTLETDVCPLRKQNYDYLIYQLVALFTESWKTETWESEKSLKDMEKFYWDLNLSRKNIVEHIQHLKQKTNNDSLPPAIKSLSANADEEEIINLPDVKDYKNLVEKILNGEENTKNLDEYKKTVLKLFKLKPQK